MGRLKMLDKEIIDFFRGNNILMYEYLLLALGIKRINKILKKINKKYINKIIIILIADDYDGIIKSYNNMIILRTSLYKSLIKPNEIVLPYIWSKYDIKFEALKKTVKPIVSFCGLASKYRINLLNKLKENENINCNFIIQKNFKGDLDPKENKRRFVENILNSHFVVCNRGTGNFSMRFYETLNLGRIPLILDTDILLPLEDKIDYENTIIIGKTEDEIIEKLLYVWENKDIELLQKECYNLYLNNFKMISYFEKIKDRIHNLMRL